MNAAPLLPPGTLLAGKFRIERLLGSGAMGAVYAIHHELTRHKRALKLLHPEARMVPDLVRRFLNEASAAGRAGNPHLVETFDAGTLPTGEPYVVMELLEGETLGALLARERVLDAPRAAEIIAQAAEGIEAAHRVGIIHRDLKPDNLFLTTRDGYTFVKILDFGVSKFLTSTSMGDMRGTRAGMVYGSPSYMSPEQLTGQVEIDARSDVFALGVVLFQCLAGGLPYDAPNIQVLTVRMLTEQPKAIEGMRSDLPPALVHVVRRALASSRDQRLPSARAMVDALASVRPTRLGAARVTPPGPSQVPYRPSSTPAPSWPAGVRRRRSSALPLLAVAGTAILAVAIALWVFRVSARPDSVAASASGAPSTVIAPLPDPVTLTERAQVEAPQLPDGKPRGDVRGKPVTESPPAAPSTSAHSSTARSLGLSQENPFR